MKTFLIIAILCLGLIACGGGSDESSPRPPTIEEQYNAVSVARTCYATGVLIPNQYAFVKVRVRWTDEEKAVFGPFATKQAAEACVKDLLMVKMPDNPDKLLLDTKVLYLHSEYFGTSFY